MAAYHISDIYNDYCNSVYGFYNERKTEVEQYGTAHMPCFEPHELKRVIVREHTGVVELPLEVGEDQVVYDINVWSTNCFGVVGFELWCDESKLTTSKHIDTEHLKKHEQLKVVPDLKRITNECEIKELDDEAYYQYCLTRNASGFVDLYKTHPLIPFLGLGSKFKVVSHGSNNGVFGIDQFTYSFVLTYKVCTVSEDFKTYLNDALLRSAHYQELNERGTLMYVDGKAKCALFRSKPVSDTTGTTDTDTPGPKIEEVNDVPCVS